jgi:hypothetical protein
MSVEFMKQILLAKEAENLLYTVPDVAYLLCMAMQNDAVQTIGHLATVKIDGVYRRFRA